MVPTVAHEKIQKKILRREMQLGAWPLEDSSGCVITDRVAQVPSGSDPIIKQLSSCWGVDHDSRLRAVTSAVVSTDSQQVVILSGVVCNLHESDQCWRMMKN